MKYEQNNEKNEYISLNRTRSPPKGFYIFFSCTIAALLFLIFYKILSISHLELDQNESDTFYHRHEKHDHWFKHISKNSFIPHSFRQCHVDEYCIDDHGQSNDFRIVCYYVIPSNTTHSRQLPPSYVDAYLCTHIIVGFASISNGTLARESKEVLEVYRTIVGFKKMNPSLRVLLSVEDFSSEGEFGKLVSKENLRSKFSVETLKFLDQFGFDGIDLDWEFPSWPQIDPDQAKNFTILLQSIKKEMLGHNSNKTYTLSVAVGAPEAIIEQSYDIHQMAEYVDFVNLMSYDFHMYTPYLPLTGPNSPLYPRPLDQGFLQTMNTNWSAWQWVRCGMPRSKINIGIPTFGHSFSLINEDNNGWNAPASGFGKVGQAGFTSYPDACYFTSDPQTNQNFDNSYLVPYAYKDKEWVSYENQISVQFKAEYVKENKFGGAMIFSLNSDDFYGECKLVKFPLLRKVSNILSRG